MSPKESLIGLLETVWTLFWSGVVSLVLIMLLMGAMWAISKAYEYITIFANQNVVMVFFWIVFVVLSLGIFTLAKSNNN